MKEKLLQIKKMIQENVRGTLDEDALEILSISVYALYLYEEPLVDCYLPSALQKAEFIVGKEDICSLFIKTFGETECHLDKQASAALEKTYAYEEENNLMIDEISFLLSTRLKNSAETIVRTCSELLHLIRSGKPKTVANKVHIVNGINVDIINTDNMQIRRKHVTFENAAVQLFADKAVQCLQQEISLLTKKELQSISPLLARFGSEISSYPYDVYSYEKGVIKTLCICPSLAEALDQSFYEDSDVPTFVERFNSLFGSSSAFLKFSKCLDEVAEKGEEAKEAEFTINRILLMIKEMGFEEVIKHAKETLK